MKDQGSDLNIHEICKQLAQKCPCKVEKAYNFLYIVNCNLTFDIKGVAIMVGVVLYSNPPFKKR